AVQVSEPGARVEVGLERAGNEVLVKVTDTSGAPPPTERPRIPLGDPSAGAARFDLARLAGVLEEHHGRLAVTHDDAAGTTITAALPVRAVAAGPTPAEID